MVASGSSLGSFLAVSCVQARAPPSALPSGLPQAQTRPAGPVSPVLGPYLARLSGKHRSDSLTESWRMSSFTSGRGFCSKMLTTEKKKLSAGRTGVMKEWVLGGGAYEGPWWKRETPLTAALAPLVSALELLLGCATSSPTVLALAAVPPRAGPCRCVPSSRVCAPVGVSPPWQEEKEGSASPAVAAASAPPTAGWFPALAPLALEPNPCFLPLQTWGSFVS